MEGRKDGFTINPKGIEEMWKAVRALRYAREQRQNDYASPTVHAKYWSAKQQLVQVVMEVFGEDWSKEAETEATGAKFTTSPSPK